MFLDMGIIGKEKEFFVSKRFDFLPLFVNCH